MARVLIIDDDAAFCQLMAKIIRGCGHDATLAFTLEDGLRESFAGDYDAVFLDVGLPDGDGLGALPKIREMPEAPEGHRRGQRPYAGLPGTPGPGRGQ